MSDENKKILALRDLLSSAEKSMGAAKQILAELLGDKDLRREKPSFDTSDLHRYDSGDEKIVEGVFTGENMLGADKRMYPVPQNYASKSHLVQGSKLKAQIAADGKIVYKILWEMPFETRVGIVIKDKDRFQVVCGDKVYNVLLASVTYLKAEVGDQVSIRVPAGKEATFACLEAVIPNKNSREMPIEIEEVKRK